ncbi:hypothetical protein Sjap_013207 [Stephania japonica]|uniref:Uncharacterized protein n=1 Tax=Stephania japonica TaxID=461633 RepID=A0AAP0IY98_9MAGN
MYTVARHVSLRDWSSKAHFHLPAYHRSPCVTVTSHARHRLSSSPITLRHVGWSTTLHQSSSDTSAKLRKMPNDSLTRITPRWPPIPTIIVNSKTHTIKVEVCGICGDNTHPTDVCPYEPEYESYPYWGNASPQPDLSYPFSSPLTPRQDEQSLEDMFKEYSSANQRLHQDILQYKENMEQHFKDINSNLQSIETLTSKMNDTLNRMLEEEEFPMLLSYDEQETLKDVTLMSVEANEHAMNEYFAIDGLTPCIYEYWSDHEESEEELEVSQSESEIVMAQTYEEEAEKEIKLTLTRPEDLHQESKDDQSFVLVNSPTLPYIFDDFEMEVDEKERSKTFWTIQKL